MGRLQHSWNFYPISNRAEDGGLERQGRCFVRDRKYQTLLVEMRSVRGRVTKDGMQFADNVTFDY